MKGMLILCLVMLLCSGHQRVWASDGALPAAKDPVVQGAAEEKFSTILAKLIDNHTIEPEQAVKIADYFRRDAERLRTLTPTEQAEQQRRSRLQKQDPVSLLIADRVITLQQAVFVEQALFTGMPPRPPVDTTASQADSHT